MVVCLFLLAINKRIAEGGGGRRSDGSEGSGPPYMHPPHPIISFITKITENWSSEIEIYGQKVMS